MPRRQPRCRAHAVPDRDLAGTGPSRTLRRSSIRPAPDGVLGYSFVAARTSRRRRAGTSPRPARLTLAEAAEQSSSNQLRVNPFIPDRLLFGASKSWTQMRRALEDFVKRSFLQFLRLLPNLRPSASSFSIFRAAGTADPS